MSEKITFTGRLAKKVIESGGGRVIAVFDSSLYLCSDTNESSLACIGTSKLVRGPINVNTSYTNLPRVAVNVPWFSDGRMLQIQGLEAMEYTIEDENPTQYPSSINWPDLNTVQQLLKRYSNNQPQHLPQYRIDKCVTKHLQQGTNSLQLWLKSGINDNADQLRTLIGCGSGLTPSGDDILIGALITLDYLGQDKLFRSLAELIQSVAPTATNRISLAHLHAACRAMAVEPLHNFVNTLFTDITATRSAVTRLENYGHRSGLDALCGVLAVTSGLHPDFGAEVCTTDNKFHHTYSASFAH